MRKWDDLSMREKAEMMRVAVSNGITTLPEIKQAYNEFAEGGAMPEAQPAENDGWSMEDEVKYREWRSKLPYNLKNTNDNDYDMREAYKADMQPTLEDDGFYHLGSRNPKTERILKAPHHPTYLKAINTDARMGYYPRTEKGITYTDTWEGNLFGGGGYKPSERIKQRITHYEGKAMTGATDPLSGKWAKNNSFESEAKNFYNALPRDIREQVLSNPELADSLYSFSYNVGAGRFKERVVPALRNYYNGKGTVQDIENSMWASGDSKLRGLQRRRAEERKGVRNALIGDVPYLPSDTPSYPTIYDMPQYIPAQPQAFSAPLTSYQPVMLPDEQQPIVREAMAYDPKEIERQERQRGLNNFMTLMSMTSPQESGNPYLDTIGMLAGNQFKKGGRIYIKPKNRGKFTKLKERMGHSATWFKKHGTPAQKKMAIFALNARKWKHGLGGYLFDGTTEDSQQMSRPNIYRYNDGRYVYQAAPDAEEIEVSPINTLLPNPSQWTYQDASGKLYTPHTAQVDTGSIIQDEERNPLVRAANNYFREAAYRAKDGTLALQGKYTMPAIAASALLPVAGEAAYPILTNPYVDAGITSAFAGHGLNHAINEGINGWGDVAMTALEVTPLGRLAKPAINSVTNATKNLYDSGTLWDAYTTFNGRLGNYSDNILTNIYGTAARRFGLPDKARIPADTMRKLSEEVNFKDGLVDFTGEKGFNGNYHINTTLDRPVVSHSGGNWDRNDLYIFPTRRFLKQTQGALKSIEPSDMFANGAAYKETPKNVTVVSGDVDLLTRARDAGMQTLSSPKLRRLYKKIPAEYQAELEEYNNTPLAQRFLAKTRRNAKYNKSYQEYADEVQRLQSQRGTPTLADFRLLEAQTGLKAGVAPLSEYNNALSGLQNMKNTIFSPGAISKIQNNEVASYIFPNGRSVDWSIKGVLGDLGSVKRAKYNKVFYDPTSHVESDWMFPDGK